MYSVVGYYESTAGSFGIVLRSGPPTLFISCIVSSEGRIPILCSVKVASSSAASTMGLFLIN